MSKVCRDCLETLDLSAFYAKATNRDGYDVRCKACNKIRRDKSRSVKLGDRDPRVKKEPSIVDMLIERISKLEAALPHGRHTGGSRAYLQYKRRLYDL